MLKIIKDLDIKIHYHHRVKSFDKLYLTRDPYNTKTSRVEQTKIKEIIKEIKGKKYNNALEIGCGIGYLTNRLAEKCKHVTGIDISPNAIKTAKELFKARKNIEFVSGNIVGFKPKSKYNLLVAVDICYYLAQEHSMEHMEEVLKEWMSWMAKDGNILLLHCFKEPSHPKDWMGRHIMEWYRSLLEKNGCKLINERVLKIEHDQGNTSRYLLSYLKSNTL